MSPISSPALSWTNGQGHPQNDVATFSSPFKPHNQYWPTSFIYTRSGDIGSWCSHSTIWETVKPSPPYRPFTSPSAAASHTLNSSYCRDLLQSLPVIECDMRPIPARRYLLGCTASNFRKLNKSHHCLGKAWSAMRWKKQMGYCFEDDKWIPLIIIDYGVRFWWSPAGGLTLEISISLAREESRDKRGACAIIMNYFGVNCTLHFRQQWISRHPSPRCNESSYTHHPSFISECDDNNWRVADVLHDRFSLCSAQRGRNYQDHGYSVTQVKL